LFIKRGNQYPDESNLHSRTSEKRVDRQKQAGLNRHQRQAEAIIATLIKHYNEQRLHASLGYMTLATWHRGQPDQVRERRAG
jgi:transposase InsO family protein